MSEPDRNVGGRPARSSREAVVEAGLEILRTDGLAAVTLGGVGTRLGLGKVALYTYVKSKDDLLLAMRDEVNRRQLEALRDDGDLAPDVALKAMCSRLVGLMADYGQLMVTVEPDLTGPGLELGERFLDVLARVGLDPAQQVRVYALLAAFLQSAVVRVGPHERESQGRAAVRFVEALQDSDAGSFPRLAALSQAEVGPEGRTTLSLVDDVLSLIVDVLIPALASGASRPARGDDPRARS